MVPDQQGSDQGDDDSWLIEIVHVLAINYGWSPGTILEEVRLSEAIQYARLAKNYRVDHYLMLLSIAHNPQQKTPGNLFDVLQCERPGDLRYTENKLGEYEPDKDGVARLKRKLQRTKGSKISSK